MELLKRLGSLVVCSEIRGVAEGRKSAHDAPDALPGRLQEGSDRRQPAIKVRVHRYLVVADLTVSVFDLQLDEAMLDNQQRRKLGSQTGIVPSSL